MKPKRVIIKSPDLDINRVFTNEQKLLKFLRHVKKSFGGTDKPVTFVDRWRGKVRSDSDGGSLKISISPCAV